LPERRRRELALRGRLDQRERERERETRQRR
jgi:hypothetical protein